MLTSSVNIKKKHGPITTDIQIDIIVIGLPFILCHKLLFSYCLSKNLVPLLYSNLLYKMGPDFFEVQY